MKSKKHSAQQRVASVFHPDEKAFTFHPQQNSSIVRDQCTPVSSLLFLFIKEFEVILIECMVGEWVEG